MKNISEVEVFLYNHKVGTLLEDEGIVYFNYSQKFKLHNLEISPIKLNTTTTKGLYTNRDDKAFQGIPGVFFDSLPDNFGMAFIDRHFEAKGYKVSEITLLDRLTFIGDRGMGALEYQPKEDDTPISNKTSINIKEAYENMKEILAHKQEHYSIEDLMNIIDSASPLGGGKPKMLVIYNDSTNTFKYNSKILPDNFERYIIKFDELYPHNLISKDLTKFEYIYMQLASECGITIPTIKLIDDNNTTNLIIKRFDRDSNDNKIHISTAAALLHKNIYIPKTLSYEELFHLTNRLTKSQGEIEQLYRRMIFNALSFNNDDHGKNFSFIMDKEGNWKQSPAYDITYSFGVMTKEHLTTINGKGANFSLDDFLKIAKENMIKEKLALEIISDTSNKLLEFQERAISLGINGASINGCIDNIKRQREIIFQDRRMQI